MIARTDLLKLAGRLRYPIQLGVVAVAYLGAAKLGLLAAVAQKVVSSAWPPSGVALATLLLLGLRYWPGIAVGALLLNWTAGVPVAGAAGIALGNTLEAVSAVWLLRRVTEFRPSLERGSELRHAPQQPHGADRLQGIAEGDAGRSGDRHTGGPIKQQGTHGDAGPVAQAQEQQGCEGDARGRPRG